jgi:ribosomal protein S18 acetylase RimI-like enzyme
MTSLVIDIRSARAGDSGQLADVHAAAWREAYSGIIPALTLEKMIVRRSATWWRDAIGRRPILVLDVGGRVAGYASFAPHNSRGQQGAAEIHELYLLPEYQGLGLGARLFRGALKRIKARGYAAVLVRALAENDRANCFYLRQGGQRVAETEETLGGRALACVWYQFAA